MVFGDDITPKLGQDLHTSSSSGLWCFTEGPKT